MSLRSRLVLFAVIWGAVPLGPDGLAQEFVQELSRSELKIIAALDQPADLEFVNMPLAEVVGYLGDFHAIDIRLDGGALQERGITADSPVTVRYKDVPLGLCLRLMLERFGLSYTIYDGQVLLVTTPARARRWMPTARFSLAAFSREDGEKGLDPAEVATLSAAVTACIDPGGWGEAEGQGSLIALPRTGPRSLMVTAPLPVQGEIAGLIAGLEHLARPETPDKWAGGTMSGVQKSLMAKVYPLAGPAERQIGRITPSVDPPSWRTAGGQGAIAAVELGPVRALVVRQTCQNHQRIAELLRK
jgi:hypothetical protein